MVTGKTVWRISLSIAMIGAWLLSGCGHMRHHGAYCGSSYKCADWMVKKLSKKLNLTADQKAVVERLKGEVLEKSKTLKEIRSGGYDEIIMQFEAARFDVEKAGAALDAHEAGMKELKTFAINKLAEFHAILTPDQRAILVKKMKKHKAACDRGNCSM